MCGSSPKQQKVVETDPVAEQAAADAKAQQEANAEIAATRKRRMRSSLLTSGASGASGPAQSLLTSATGAGTPTTGT